VSALSEKVSKAKTMHLSPAKPLILIVEDNLDIQVILQVQLNRQGYNTLVKSDGEQTLLWLQDNKPDLVLLDLMLPGMDGLEICRRIRHQYAANIVPIIILSSLGADVNERVRGLEAGANDFMGKPYHIAELAARIKLAITVKTETEHAENLLSRYVSQVLRKQAELDPEMLHRRDYRHGVILFADLRGFTRLSANTHAADVLSLLDDFFDAMMQIIDDHGGVVFDIIGDELLAAFNVPHEVPIATYLSVQAALEMQRTFRLLQNQWAKSGLNVGLGIGIDQGEVVIGNIGAKSLFRYTVMGNVVNMASRLLAFAKDGEVVISANVHNELASGDMKNAFSLTVANIKGIEMPQQIYHTSVLLSLTNQG
jgi:class 3 adenylate cyclase